MKPYFWKSWWFVIIVTLAVAALLLWQLRQRMEKLRRQEAEKLMVPIRKAMDEADDPEQLQAQVHGVSPLIGETASAKGANALQLTN